MIGAQASNDQLEKILSYIAIGKDEGAQVLTGGERATHEGELAEGYYVTPTVLKGHNGMRIFQEEIFGPVLAVTTFKDEAEALAIANDTLYGLGAVCGRATDRAPIAWAGAFRRAACGPIATMPIPPMRPLAATSSRASGARTTR
jgi:acyl-CoA reductase-like NAD-dependent aldehyde dehydrogenase